MLILVRQIKAARCLVGWQQLQLAIAAGVGIVTIRRIERMMGAINPQVRDGRKDPPGARRGWR
ncbi:helix-turn-helix domain-containing protein [Bradyrhizobium sp. USDA 4461]